MIKNQFKILLMVFSSVALLFGILFFTFLALQNKLDFAWVFVRSFGSMFVILTIASIIFLVLYKKSNNPNSKIGKLESEQRERLKMSIRSLELQIQNLARQTNTEEYLNIPSKVDVDNFTELNKITREYSLIVQKLTLKLMEMNLQNTDNSQNGFDWTCKYCGTVNSSDSNFCKNCGNQKS